MDEATLMLALAWRWPGEGYTLPNGGTVADVICHDVQRSPQEIAAAVAEYEARPAPVPEVISDRQFFQALAIDGYITTAEALAAVRTGDLPSVLAELLDHMDGAERFGAEMLLSGATEFRRDHPMTIAIGEARGMTADEVDDFFRRAAAL